MGGILLVEGVILGAHIVCPVMEDRQAIISTVEQIPMAYYVVGEYQQEWSNWWIPNVSCLRDWVTSSGFSIKDIKMAEGGTRAYLLAEKNIDLDLAEHIVL